MIPTTVVTCFLRRTDQAEPQILLVRRCQRVGSYHARWAGVSGLFEEEGHQTNRHIQKFVRRRACSANKCVCSNEARWWNTWMPPSGGTDSSTPTPLTC